ncbi:MAG: OmpA family protein [Thiobacillus sp.]
MNFAVGAKTLDQAAQDALNATAAYLKDNASARVDISGFTDKTGDPVKNAELAKLRAFAVRDALLAAGVTEDRVNLKKPENITGSAENFDARRVEVRLAN